RASCGIATSEVQVTRRGAASRAVDGMGAEVVRYGKDSLMGVVTGMVASIGTITPASGFVGPTGGILIGLVAGVVCFFATQLLKRVLHLDDSLDVSPVHGVRGIAGPLLTGELAATALGGAGCTVQQRSGAQLAVQALGVGITIAWCGLVTWGLLKLLDATLGLRVSQESETQGLDLSEHGERGYST